MRAHAEPTAEPAGGCGRWRTATGALFAALLALLTAAPARAQSLPVGQGSAPDAGTAFEPRPLSKPLYATAAPINTTVPAADGARLYVETYLPAPKNGNVPPERIPTILIASPYENPQTSGASAPMSMVNHFVARGYAVSFGHVRGSGRSEGCPDLFGPKEVDATARIIEYVGRDAPWTDGNVGMYGISYPAATAVGAATLGDPDRTKYLKAIIPVAPLTSAYEFVAFDGVPIFTFDDAGVRVYVTALTFPDWRITDPDQTLCQASLLAESRVNDGDFGAWHAAREYRRGVSAVQPAVLFVQGLLDYTGHVRSPVAFFDRLPGGPHKAVIGQWDHAPADGDNATMGPVNRWPRADPLAMSHAWFDRWLMRLPTGVEQWPDVQVQGVDGQWREEAGWPATGGPPGQLALGAGGTLGGSTPEGSTSYPETSMQVGALRGTQFGTPPLDGPLHLTGQPELDLWVELDRPDAHFAARLHALDAAGNLVTQDDVRLDGFRSARHLDPLVEGRFEQAEGRPAPVGTPVNVRIRFAPLDVTVPAGGRLVLGLSGGASWPVFRAVHFTTLPAGSGATVKVLHDCAHPSVLRFVMPHENARLLNVREYDEPIGQPLVSNPSPRLSVDGDGLAKRRVCGVPPRRP